MPVMAERNPRERPPVTVGEKGSVVPREVPFSLMWLNAVDPRIFTPITLLRGGVTQIRLRSPDETTNVTVYRTIGHNLHSVDLNDEIMDANEEGVVSRFNYEIGSGPNGQILKHGKSPVLTEHMQRIVRGLSGLVGIKGSSIKARNREFGDESSFVSDGVRWKSEDTGEFVVPLPELVVTEPPALR